MSLLTFATLQLRRVSYAIKSEKVQDDNNHFGER